jgi:hypothetical protein
LVCLKPLRDKEIATRSAWFGQALFKEASTWQ